MSIAAQLAYLASIGIGLAVNIGLIRLGERYQRHFMARDLLLTLLGSNIILIAWLGISLAPSADVAFLWVRLRFIGIALTTVALFSWVMHHLGLNEWMRFPRVLLIAFAPLVEIGFVVFAPHSPLFFTSWRFIEYDLINVEASRFGLWGNFYSAYGVSLILAALAMVGRRWSLLSKRGRLQLVWVLGGVLISGFIGNINGFGWLPAGAPNPTPYGTIIGGMMIGIGLRYFPPVDVAPVAHEVIFRNLREAVIVTNQQHQIVDFNPQAEALLQGENPILGQHLEAYPPLATALLALNDSGEIELQVGEQRRWMDVRVVPLNPSKRAAMLGRAYILTDISARKASEHEQQNLIETLDAYARSVAHDLKNPIGLISGYLDLALSEAEQPVEAPRLSYYLGRAKQGTQTMENIVGSLLLLASLRRSSTPEMEIVNLNQVAQSVLARLELPIQAQQAEIYLATDLPDVRGYANWIEEMLLNYVSNALKYGGKPPKTRITAETRGNVVVCAVQDNGEGLSVAEQRSLFQNFSRLEKHSEQEGHGLGLAIVRQMAERMGGAVAVHSALGVGSTFSFTLPRA